jgi:plastocyanin
MRRALLLLLLIATCGLVLAACGDSDDGGGGAGGGTTTSEPATGGGSGAVEVTMENIAFNPETVTVKVGQRITWTNEDGVQHDVESTSGEKIDSDLFGEGGTFSFTPKKAGTIEYVCTVHPGMDGEIVVTK